MIQTFDFAVDVVNAARDPRYAVRTMEEAV
jgi:hypothetical protein